MVDFGQKLRNLRLEAGMTQAELAQRLDITKAVISYYELHKRCPSPEVLIKLASIFHISTDYLLGISNRKMIDVSDLSEEEVRLLLSLIVILSKKN